ncbi:MAG TPA: hypothetical protein DCZ93_07855 [Elusimicrobia bacterium]|nr:hypothetical protein [Elusimicrobiota bacterium]
MKNLKLVAWVAVLLFTKTFLWAIPAGFNIQGRLTDANGVNKDGTFQIKFSVYSADMGGSPVWEKNLTAVTVKNGNFQVILQGQGDNSAQLETAVKDLEAAYVEIKVGSEAPLVPRQPLLRSPFSSADRVSGKTDVLIQSDSQSLGSGLIAMKTGNTDRLTILNNGNVGVGTSTPAKKLSVAGDMEVSGAISAGNLVGAVMFFAGAACPAGWLRLDGSARPVSDYPGLFAQIGYLYGGSGNNFLLPNMSDGSFIRAAGGNAAPVGAKQADAIISHTHTTPSLGYYRDYGPGRYGLNDYAPGNVPTNSQNPPGAAETRPLNYSMTPCIKF